MKFRRMGNTGLPVSRACLGTMTFGAKDWGCDQTTAHRLLDLYAEAGGNFIDTANTYSGGASEQIVGDWLHGRNRDDFVIATKCFFRLRPVPTARGLSRKHIIEAVDLSLKRLKTDYIDLQYAHGPDHTTPVMETMSAFDELIRAGKIRYTGCSNFKAWQIMKANGVADARGLHRFACGQYLYNLIVRICERDVLPACVDQGMGFTAWSPLGGGMLTGKYKGRAEPDAGTRAAHRSGIDGPRFWHPWGRKVASALDEVAARLGVPSSKLALGWILKNPHVNAVIMGVRTEEQLKDNLAALETDVPTEVADELNQLTAPEPDYLDRFADHARRNTADIEM